MTRRALTAKEHLDTARNKVSGLLATPLKAIAGKLGQTLEQTQCAFEAGSSAPDKLIAVCSYVCQVVDRLPQQFGDRFFFDAAMIQAMATDWDGSLALSRMIIPSYGPQWGHARLQMPSEDQVRTHVIDLIILPEEDRLDDVDLLSYPLLAHELGHSLLLTDDSSFRNAFSPSLAKRVRSLKLASIADQGAARAKGQAIINELEELWTPSADQRNWAHELAIDLVALWACGPAYLACFEDTVEHQRPYDITQDHPPYAVRLDALVDCGRKLGFVDHCNGLEKLRANCLADAFWLLEKQRRKKALIPTLPEARP